MSDIKSSGSSANSSKNPVAAVRPIKVLVRNKVRVLCLHGYRQNADVFKNKLGSLRKYVNRYVEFVFINAPHPAKSLVEGEEPKANQLSWWFNKDDGSFKGTNKNGPAFGFHESLKLVETAWRTQGPFQGLLGFSQGACFVGLICGLSNRKLTCIKPEFAVLASGFISGSLAHMSAYEEPITIPTLHIYGCSDDIIPKAMSEDLLKLYKNVEIIEHAGGHYLPATAQQKKAYVHFFQDRLQEYLENLELQQTPQAVAAAAVADYQEDAPPAAQNDAVQGNE